MLFTRRANQAHDVVPFALATSRSPPTAAACTAANGAGDSMSSPSMPSTGLFGRCRALPSGRRPKKDTQIHRSPKKERKNKPHPPTLRPTLTPRPNTCLPVLPPTLHDQPGTNERIQAFEGSPATQVRRSARATRGGCQFAKWFLFSMQPPVHCPPAGGGAWHLRAPMHHSLGAALIPPSRAALQQAMREASGRLQPPVRFQHAAWAPRPRAVRD